MRLLQHRRGYRFSLDAVLLASFAQQALAAPGRRPVRAPAIADLGTGCGVVALLLARRTGAGDVAAVELQSGLARLAARNARLNALPVRVLEADLRDLRGVLPAGAFHLVTCNPPYHAGGHTRPGGDPERRAARHEGLCTLGEAAAAAGRLVRPGGAAVFVYPAPRLVALLDAFGRAGLAPVRLRLVHPREGAPAMLALLEGAPRSRRPLLVEPPLVVHEADGTYRPEVARLLGRGGP